MDHRMQGMQEKIEHAEKAALYEQRAMREAAKAPGPYTGRLGIDSTSPPTLSVAELAARCDPRLHHKAIMVTSDGIVLVQMEGGWQTLLADYSVKIDLAAPRSLAMAGAMAPDVGSRR